MKQPSELCLDTALRLAAIGTMPHGVPRVVLMFYETMYGMLQTFIPCETCLQQRELLEQVKQNASRLDEHRLYYQSHIEQFRKETLKLLIRANIALLDISFLCDSCLDNVQQDLDDAFQSTLAKQQIIYHVRSKKKVVLPHLNRSTLFPSGMPPLHQRTLLIHGANS